MLNFAKYSINPLSKQKRIYKTKTDKYRNDFQRDIGRIIHSTAFRRLRHKTQVFINDESDHYRTRLTHTLEVSQIARSISRYFRLNEDLTEAISLAHDLGHAPFGHAGEDALVKSSSSYFNHNDQSFRIVTFLERAYLDFDGLNLTMETLEGIAKHNGPIKKLNEKSSLFKFNNNFADLNLFIFPSLEAQIASISDDIAYINHDLDDGFRANLLKINELKRISIYKELDKELISFMNLTLSKKDKFYLQKYKKEIVRRLINKMVVDLINQSEKNIKKINPKNIKDIKNTDFFIISFSKSMNVKIKELRSFLNKKMYNHKKVRNKSDKYKKIIEKLYNLYFYDKLKIPDKWVKETYKNIDVNKKQIILDYISGMTDRFILNVYNKKK